MVSPPRNEKPSQLPSSPRRLGSSISTRSRWKSSRAARNGSSAMRRRRSPSSFATRRVATLSGSFTANLFERGVQRVLPRLIRLVAERRGREHATHGALDVVEGFAELTRKRVDGLARLCEDEEVVERDRRRTL